jgi:hypothetical protein
MVRETLNGVHGRTPFGTDEVVEFGTALRSYTAWNARQLFLENEIGTLEVGKYADLVVWNTDLSGTAPDAVRDMHALMTMVEGEVVFTSVEF